MIRDARDGRGSDGCGPSAGARATTANFSVPSGPNESLFDPKLRLGGSALVMNRLFQPNRRGRVFSLPGKRRIHRGRFPIRPAADEREVFLPNLAALHRESEAARRRGIFGDKDEAARLAIEPVDDRNLAAVDQLESEKLAQRGPKRRRAVRFARMNEEERRFIDYEVILRLVDDPEIDAQPCALPGRR